MWGIRILSGQQAGQIFPLQPGKHLIGRAPSCEVKINSTSVSKEHASILITGDKVIISDLESRNGTFVNGVRIQNQRVNPGDKIGIHDILMEVLQVPESLSLSRPLNQQKGVYEAPPPAWAGNAAIRIQQMPEQPSYGPQMEAISHEVESHSQPNSIGGIFNNLKVYIDTVAMPGVYALAQTMPYRYAIALLVAIYVVTVTALSTIPVVQTTKENIREESLRRAKTIARNMAATNRSAIVNNNEVGISVRAAELEEGVTDAVIISAKDGTVIAPANKRGEFLDKPFVQKARRETDEIATFINDSNLGVSVPIAVYSPETGTQAPVAYAIVLYDMGSLAMNASQTLTLFIKTLAIALIVGAILYLFLIKVIEHPIVSLNAQLDDALREGRDDLQTEYQHLMLENLASNINSALSRIDHGGMAEASVFVNRDLEAANLVRMLNSPALTVNAVDDRVIVANQAFDTLVGGGMNLQGRSLSDIPDVALQQNLIELLPRMRQSLGEIALSEIPFSGRKYEICGQAVMGASEPAYFLIIINPMGDG